MKLLPILTGKPENSPTINFTRVYYNGREWYLLQEVEKYLGVTQLRSAINSSSEYEKGIEYIVLENGNLKELKGLLNCVNNVYSVNPHTRSLILLSRSGLNLVATKTEKPIGKALRRWLSREVLPEIQDTGCYNVVPKSEISLDLRVSTLKTYADMLKDVGESNSALIVMSHIAEALGIHNARTLLPKMEKQYYTPTELGRLLGRSSQAIGRTLKKLGLHGKQDAERLHSEAFKDKSPYSTKEVVSYRYDDCVLKDLELYYAE